MNGVLWVSKRAVVTIIAVAAFAGQSSTYNLKMMIADNDPVHVPANRTKVTLSSYDAAGRLVRTLADEVIDEGRHERAWDCKEARGNSASSGVCF